LSARVAPQARRPARTRAGRHSGSPPHRAQRTMAEVNSDTNGAKITFKSTRGGVKGLTFEEAVFEGLAPDGGLLVPDRVPDVSKVFKTWKSLSFHEIAFEIASLFIGDEIPEADLRDMMMRNYKCFEHPDTVPCIKVGDLYFTELFYGPSLSFKDVALQALGNFYEYFLKRKERRLTIICATSGDTGSAAIYGLRGKDNVETFVLFPEGRVSAVQQKQMVSVLDPNVHCIAVKGTFDDCQDTVKALFSDLPLKKRLGLGAVNSINWSRIMSQITYYFHSYFKTFPECDGTMSFSVPTGNFGDILAGYYAKRMGLPVKSLICASNANDILHRFFTTGEYDQKGVCQTSAPSMDIQISSNFERYLYYLFDEDCTRVADAMAHFRSTGQLHVTKDLLERAQSEFLSASASDEVIAKIIRTYSEEHKYALCPHTACGIHAAVQVRDKLPTSQHETVVLATAHAAKFNDAVRAATGHEPDRPASLARLDGARTHYQSVGPTPGRSLEVAVQRHVQATLMDCTEPEDTDLTSDRCEALPLESGMLLVAMDVEGTLTPEAWLRLKDKTGIEELSKTTAHEPDYDKLMMYRINVLRRHGIKLKDMMDVVKDMGPLPGALEFLQWLESVVPRVLLLTDTFEEYAMPMFEALNYPCVFCNSLTIDEDGFIVGHILRLRDQKRKAVEAFQRLNFRIIAIGDSFNDISMLKAAEAGILMYPSERVVQAHPEFPVCRSYEALREKVTEILQTNAAMAPRPLTVPAPLEFEAAYRSMWLVLANVAGTFAPEPWLALQATTGIDELKTTTAHVPDYDKLMQYRMGVLRDNNIKLEKVFDVLKDLDPLPGAKEFMQWLRPIVPRSFMITDTFEEYALPVFAKLGHPMVFCNFIGADEDGYMSKHFVRVHRQKQRAVEEFQRLNFRIIAIGYSFNDIPMLKTAEQGILFKPSSQLVRAHPEVPTVQNYEELKAKIMATISESSSRKCKPSDA